MQLLRCANAPDYRRTRTTLFDADVATVKQQLDSRPLRAALRTAQIQDALGSKILRQPKENSNGCGGFLKVSSKLLELDGSASFFQLSLSSFSVVLVCAFEDSLRCALYELLSFLQAQAGNEFANSLNDADLLCASIGQDNVKLVLLFLSSSSFCTWC